MSDIECPYCGEHQDINHDDGYGYGEDEFYEQECVHCEKTFSFVTSISFNYDVNRAPCLNGGDHKYMPTHTWPKFYTRMRCEYCDKEREPTDGEWYYLMEPMECVSGWVW